MNIQSDEPDSYEIAYRSAIYTVESVTSFVFSVDVFSEGLADTMRCTNSPTSAFITAFNPLSEIASVAENESKHEALVSKLTRLGLTFRTGYGRDASGNWPAERSVLAIGITYAEACQIASEFQQNAFLWIGRSAIPRLTWVAKHPNLVTQDVVGTGIEIAANARMCPRPARWAKIYEQLSVHLAKITTTDSDEAFGSTSLVESDPVPVALVLDGWHYSSRLQKYLRWRETIEWAARNDSLHLLADLQPSDYA